MLEKNCEEYIYRLLGVRIRPIRWTKNRMLPRFLNEMYGIKTTEFLNTRLILAFVKNQEVSIVVMKKHARLIQQLEDAPVMFVFESLTRYQYESLLTANIPFVIPGKQLYMPQLGMYLLDKFSTRPKVEKLQPTAQLLLFYYLYQRKSELFANEAIHALGVSPMTISRAVKQLVATGLFTVQKKGSRITITGNRRRKELFDEILPRLVSPIRKTIYIDKKETLRTFVLQVNPHWRKKAT
ncbi:MAG: hypothetical protein Q4C70_10580 [Planctomycetia bacterium]|nr:hypothetical protein [Planctomycetia bacterium]